VIRNFETRISIQNIHIYYSHLSFFKGEKNLFVLFCSVMSPDDGQILQ